MSCGLSTTTFHSPAPAPHRSWRAPGPARCQWLFSKCLTASDTNKLARIILPRQAVDAFLPHVEDRAGLDLDAWDTAGARWTFKLKCARPASRDPESCCAKHPWRHG